MYIKMSKAKNKQDNTMLWILLVILLVCFIMIGFLFYKYFYSGISASKYGSRLEGAENYPLSETLESDIKGLYTDDKTVGEVKINVEGKIIYIDIDFVESVKLDAAKSAANKTLEKIGEDNLKFYELQFVLTYSGEAENTNFPIFGSKNSNSLKVVWSK